MDITADRALPGYGMHQIIYQVLNGNDAIYIPHTENTSWTPDDVEQAFINGMKAGNMSVRMQEFQWLKGGNNSMPEVVRDFSDRVHALNGSKTHDAAKKELDRRTEVHGIRYHCEPHHIDQFEDVIFWPFLIPETKRHFFWSVLKQKISGRKTIQWDDIRKKFYVGKRAPTCKMRFDYRNILIDLTLTLNHLNYPKRG